MGRRWLLAGAAWLITAALTTAVAIGAVNSLRQGIFGPSDAPRSEVDVRSQLPSTSAPSTSTSAPSTSAPSASVTPPASAATPSAAAPVSRAFTTDGGAITASCTGGQAYLLSWIPKSGFEADHVQRGPAAVVSLRFKARSGGAAVRAQVTCPGGVPELAPGAHD